MKRYFITIVMACILSANTYSQVYIGGGTTSNMVGENESPYFVSANTNTIPSRRNQNLLNGKGLAFPRVDLSSSQVTFGITLPASISAGNQYASYLDGLVVYNIATSGVANPSIGNTEGKLTPGFWYYDNNNPTGSTPNERLVSGTWRPLSSGTSSSNYIWMPSFNLPWDVNAGTEFKIDLYAVYVDNLESTGGTHNATLAGGGADPTAGHKFISSDGSTIHPFGTTVPLRTELVYIVTDYDDNVITDVALSTDGILTYKTAVAGTPPPEAYVDIALKKIQ
jgi:hypothetical protein